MMKIIAGLWFVAYVLAWWLTFWLPARKGVGSPVAFIPAAICAFGIPMLVADFIHGNKHCFFLFWAMLPFVIVAAKVFLRMKRNNQDHTSDGRDPKGV